MIAGTKVKAHTSSDVYALSFVQPHQLSRTRGHSKLSKTYASNDATDGDDNINNDQASAQTIAYQTKTRFRARVSYCGTQYYGWQWQPDRTTIQGEIEGILSRRFHRRIPVLGAGRTDAGVHARGQAVHFDLYEDEIPFSPPPPTIPRKEDVDVTAASLTSRENQQVYNDYCNELQYSMNRMLPLDIRIFNLQLAPYQTYSTKANDDDTSLEENDTVEETPQAQQSMPRLRPWHAIQSASSKWYSYRLTLGPTLWNPMERYTRTHFLHRPAFASKSTNGSSPVIKSRGWVNEPYALTKQDIDQLSSILSLYEGTHEFKAFGSRHEQNEKKTQRKINTIRTVYRVELVREPLKEDYNFGNGIEETNMSQPPSYDQSGFIGEEGNYRIDFHLQGALYKQVRNMVGTAIEVWLGRMTEEKLVGLLQIQEEVNSDDDENTISKKEKKKVRRQDNPFKPAPPEGLTLECVYYDDNF